MSLKNKTITGIIWNFAEQIGRRGIGVIITLLLARFLSPEDYGLVAMMAVFLAIATSLMDSGFKQALIRLPEANQTDFNTAFLANIALGLLGYVLLFLAAPFIAGFYDEPRLIILIRVAGISIIISSFQVVQSAVLSRNLNFKVQLQASLPAGTISGVVAVTLAFMGWGVWALILQMILASFITTVLLWHLQGWRPSLSFSKASLGSMYNFGYKLFLSGLLDTIFNNIYVVVIAKIFSGAIAGYYYFAVNIKNMVIGQLVVAISTVTYPALASIQHDDIRLKAGYRQIVQVTTFILFPSMAMLAALADPLFRVLLPDKWLPAVVYLQLMCISGLLYPLHAINLNILKVKGRSDLFLYLEVYKRIVTLIILAVSVRYGVIGILVGQIIGSVLAYIPNSYWASRLINYPIHEQAADFMPGLILSCAVALVVYVAGFVVHWPALIKLVVFTLIAGLLYMGGAHLFRFQAYLMARQMLTNRLSRV